MVLPFFRCERKRCGPHSARVRRDPFDRQGEPVPDKFKRIPNISIGRGGQGGAQKRKIHLGAGSGDGRDPSQGFFRRCGLLGPSLGAD